MNDFKIKIIKRITIIIVFVLCCSVMYGFLSKAIVNSFKDSDLFSQKEAIHNMKYSYDGENFYDINDISDIPKEDKNNLIITGEIVASSFVTPELFIESNNNYYDIYINGERFMYKDKTDIDLFFKFIDYKELASIKDGSDIKIFLYANDTKDLGNIENLYVANRVLIMYYIVYLCAFSTIFALVAIVIGILLSLTILSDRCRVNGLNVIGYLSVLIGAMWTVSFNPLNTIIFSDLYFLAVLNFIILLQIPVAIIVFTEKYENEPVARRRYRNFINIYLVFVVIVTVLNLAGVIKLYGFNNMLSTCIAFSILLSIKLFSSKIERSFKLNVVTLKALFGRKLDKYEEMLLKAAENANYEYSIFDRVMPLAFSVFLTVNLVSLVCNTIFSYRDLSMNIIGVSTIIFVLFSCVVFAYDLKKLNYNFVIDQEKMVLNAIRINLLVKEQNSLFLENNVDDICEKFYSKVMSILFPYGETPEIDKNLLDENNRNDYINTYKYISENVSSIIYMIVPEDESVRNDFKNVVMAATGKYKECVNKDPYLVMDKDDLGHMLFIMKGLNEPEASEISVIIGSEENPSGIILFKNMLEVDPFLRGLIESFTRTCSILIENLILLENAKFIQRDTVYNLNEISELRSKETGFHIRRVSLYSALIGKKLGMSEEEIEILQLASSMHDIGKINIPDAILNKPGKLTDEEFVIMKTHAQLGYDILKNTNNKVMEVGAIIAKYHHEKYNGKGYFGVVGQDIPLMARIVAVTDVFDALSVVRVYKEAWPLERILKLFEEERNQHFDGNLVSVLVDNLDEFLEIRDKFKEKD